MLFIIRVKYFLVILAVSVSNVSLSYAQGSKLDSTIIKDLIQKAKSIQFSDFETAKEYLKRSVKLSRSNDYKELEAQSRYLLSLVYKNADEKHSGIKEAEISLDVYKRLNHINGQIKVNIALGHMEILNKNYLVPEQYYKRAILLSDEVNNILFKAHACLGFGNLLVQMDSFKRADQNYAFAEDVFANREKELYAQTCYNRAEVNNKLNQTEISIDYYNKSLNSYKQLGDQLMQANINRNLGDLFFILGEANLATKHYQNCLDIGTVINSEEHKMDAHFGLAKTSETNAEFKKAFYHLENYHRISDSLIKKDNDQGAMALEIKYQLEKRQKELEQFKFKSEEGERKILQRQSAADRSRAEVIKANEKTNALLIGGGALILLLIVSAWSYLRQKRKNELISKQSLSIQEQNDIIDINLREKELLLKEIHHRVKNNLQMISSMLNLQSHQMKSKEAVEALQDGRMRIQAIALIHEKLYGNDQFATISCREYLSELLMNQLTAVDKKGRAVSYDFDIANRQLDLDIAVPLGLIISELAVNSLKHAFTDTVENPTITIKTTNNTNGSMLLDYKDNGIGLPIDFQNKVRETLGFEIITALTDQLDGDLIFKEANGTHVQLHLLKSNN